MHLFKYPIFLISLLFGICQLSFAQEISIQEYIDEYKALAVAEMKRVGIPASITMAQGILESRNGNSYLATVGNNHFGVKCHDDWTGKKIHLDDDAPNECFRKYKSVYESFIDHSNFLSRRGRYSALYELDPLDYKSWSKGLKDAGYATDPQYANKLITLIERYELFKFDLPGGIDCDNIVLDLPAITYYNRIKTVIFTCDITIAQVARAYGMEEKSLRKYNDFDSEVVPANNKVYFQPKRNKGPFGLKTHIVQRGESMVSISQLYGIKLKCLYDRNRMDMGKEQQAAAGQELQLRGKRKSPPVLSNTPIVKPPVGQPNNPPIFIPNPSTDDSSDEEDLNDFEITPPVINPPVIKIPPVNPSTDDKDTPTSITHIVKKGDTLYSISQQYGVTVETIKATNGLTSNDLNIGQRLKIKK
ncbi:MAG: glucosaminidase domain-containing protein [Chitinophagales bacterium]